MTGTPPRRQVPHHESDDRAAATNMPTGSVSDHVADASPGRPDQWSEDETSSAWAANDDVFEQMTTDLTEVILEHAALVPGHTVLDLACGTGNLAFNAADRVQPQGAVSACDLSPGMIKVAEFKAATLPAENVAFQVADAHRLPYVSDSFDRVLCRLGVMFFDAEMDALREVRRVLKNDGRAVFLVWGRPSAPFFQTTLDVVTSHLDSRSSSDVKPAPFRFSDPGHLAAAFRHAGFTTAAEHRHDILIRWDGTAEEFVRWRLETTSGPFQMLFREMLRRSSAAARRQMSVEMTERVKRYETSSVVSIPIEAVVVVAEH
jgi:ubiquinone/menaquinone biosynthesis C-methylase UbiE